MLGARRERSDRGATPGRAHRRIGPLRFVPVTVAFSTIALGVFAGTAYAYFSATGSGSGQAGVGTLLPLHIEHATATVSRDLFPDGQGTLVLSLTNPNAFAVTVVGVVQDGPVTVTGGGAGCKSGTVGTPGTSGVAVAPVVANGLNLSVAAGSSVTVTVATGATMSTTSNTTCQGASFEIPVTVTVHA